MTAGMETTRHVSAKAEKEAFVTGLSGTSKLEIFAIIASLSLSILVCEHVKSKRQPAFLRTVLELLLVIYPQLLICTGALPLWPTLLVFALAASVSCIWDASRPGRAARHDLPGLDDLAGPRKSFIGLSRGLLMAATCICILAVDFRAFPRRYAKAEAYGTGYMDVGVGGVVLTAGFVSPAAGLGNSSSSWRRGGSGGGGRRRWRPPPLWRRLVSGLRGAAACWVLGLARLLTTRAVDYQTHVGEYGVHWNFFHTIAVVALLGAAVAVPAPLLVAAAVAVTAVHQGLLTLGGLGPWVMSPARGSDLVSLNKEGLVSCTGYWALYLWGAALSNIIHVTAQHAVRQLEAQHGGAKAVPPAAAGASAADAGRLAGGGGRGKGCGGGGGAAAVAAPLVRWWLQVVALDAVLWVAVGVLEARVEPISRRSCNAAYVMWIAAQCLAAVLPPALWQALATAAGAAEAAASAADGAGDAPRDVGLRSSSPESRTALIPLEPLEAADNKKLSSSSSFSSAVAALTRRRGGWVPRADTAAGGDNGDDDGRRGESSPRHPSGQGSRWAATRRGEGESGPLVRGAGSAGPRVLQAMNCNPLAIFLVANLATGAINLTVDTLQVADWPARAILGAYITSVCGLALLFDARGWRLKL